MRVRGRFRRAGAVLAVSLAVLAGCAATPVPDTSVLPWPNEAAAIGYRTGQIVAHNDEQPRSIASLAKVVSALVVLEKYPIDAGSPGASIEVDDSVLAVAVRVRDADGIVLPASPGTSLSQADLLAGSLIASASNYAEMLAVWAFGSTEKYVDAAELWLDKNGLTQTSVTDASGIDGGSVGTAADMVALGRLALASPVVAELVGSAEVTIGGHTVDSTNDLLGIGFTGIKTGTDARSHLLFSRPIGDQVVVGAVLGAASAGHARRAAVMLTDALLE